MQLLFFISISAFACNVVVGPNITAKDLAAVNPPFANLDPAAIVTSSPIPGVKRVLHPAELARIAKAPGPFDAICFERPTRILAVDDLLLILESALTGGDFSPRGASAPQFKIEILDYTR